MTGARRKDVRGPQFVPSKGRIEIDWSQVQRMARRLIPVSDIAGILSVGESTLRRAAMRDLSQPLQDFIAQHGAHGRATLRRAQWRRALQGSDRMLIFLGKNHLNQTERAEITTHGTPLMPTSSIDMSKLSDDALREIVDLFDKAQAEEAAVENAALDAKE